MKNFTFHKCTIDDWQSLQKISIQTFKSTYEHKNDPQNFKQHLEVSFNEKKLKSELSNSNSAFYFLTKNENEKIGYLKLNEFDAQTEEMSEDYLEIERIYLLKEMHGKGLGKLMIEFSKKIAFQKQKKKIWLGVWSENPNAIGFYTKMGFEKTGTHIFKVGDDEQLDYVMEINIPYL